jgi:2-polyprenyl-6-hydroxyphenyl methylase/3-demethylubiquinone-9 3-methyltransferase
VDNRRRTGREIASFYPDGGGVTCWWDDCSPLSCLHTSLNPARFPYFREVLLERLAWDPTGKTALDVGCGGGLLAEEFARLGCRVTGIDPAVNALAAARAHAQAAGLDIDYRQGVGETLPFEDASFEIAYCCDVLEHVTSVDAVIAEVARVLRPGGVFLYDTINRTLASKPAVIKVPQDWLKLAPADFHLWELFTTPAELHATLARHGLEQHHTTGLRPGGNPLATLLGARQVKQGRLTCGEFGRRSPWVRTRSLAISYMGYAVKPA